jgi:hypothetical protein
MRNQYGQKSRLFKAVGIGVLVGGILAVAQGTFAPAVEVDKKICQGGTHCDNWYSYKSNECPGIKCSGKPNADLTFTGCWAAINSKCVEDISEYSYVTCAGVCEDDNRTPCYFWVAGCANPIPWTD